MNSTFSEFISTNITFSFFRLMKYCLKIWKSLKMVWDMGMCPVMSILMFGRNVIMRFCLYPLRIGESFLRSKMPVYMYIVLVLKQILKYSFIILVLDCIFWYSVNQFRICRNKQYYMYMCIIEMNWQRRSFLLHVTGFLGL